MPPTEKRGDGEPRERDRDRENDRERKPKGPGGKAKDLSHVPCKFFKVGGCTAGAACPFSHTAVEPGQSKDVCSWYVKGNCKFGHKCALAHILPGQSMSMDRKNKKAAQVANAANGPGPRDRGGRGQRNSGPGGPGGPGGGGGGGKNPLLGGSTAPTRMPHHGNRAPNPLKSSISPSAPAPAITDTDFAAFGLDENAKLSSAPAQEKAGEGESQARDSDDVEVEVKPPSPSPLPVNMPRRPSVTQRVDFGPIGSPTRSSPSTSGVKLVNGFSPGTSPQGAGAGALSTSPFSAPGTQTVFRDSSKDYDFRARSGIAASLGATRAWATEMGQPGHIMGSSSLGGEVAVDDGDLEDFVPGSLTDLLTPEERSRRMSRTNSGRPVVTRDALRPSDAQTAHHRYSRSVPGPSLLSDIRSIWSENPAGPPGLGNGTPSSFKSSSQHSASGFGGREEQAALGLSPPMLSPTNASAAFLPGLHTSYIHAKTGLGVRGPELARSPPGHGGFAPLPAEAMGAGVVSPSAIALQAHAPGQSLPQGLAAGYSRMHARPAPASPGGGGIGYEQWVAEQGSPRANVGAGLFSRLGYAGAAGRSAAPPPAPPGQGVRSVSGRGWLNGQTPLSPLSGPVLMNDDDDVLFSMDH